jgi:hypothetical protein
VDASSLNPIKNLMMASLLTTAYVWDGFMQVRDEYRTDYDADILSTVRLLLTILLGPLVRIHLGNNG